MKIANSLKSKTKQLILVLLVIASGSQTLFAQSNEKTNFSLQESIDYALEHNRNIANAKFDVYIAEKKAREYRAIGLPQVNGSFDFSDMEVVPTTVIPASAFNPFAPEDSLMAVQFGIRFNGTANLQASQMIFDPSFFVGLKALKMLKDLSTLNTQRTEIETATEVSKAYYTVLVSETRLELLSNNIQRLDEILNTTKALYANGFVEKIDVDRLQISFNNLNQEKSKVERMVDLTRDLLKFQMGMDIFQPIVLTDSIAKDQAELPSFEGLPTMSVNFNNRIEYKMLETQLGLQEINKKRYQIGRIPSMFAFGSYSRQALRQTFTFFDTKKDWYPSAIIGFKLSVPIFDGFRTRSLIQQTEAEIWKIENNKLMLEQAISLEVRNASANLLNSYSNLKSYKETLDLAEEVNRITQKKYEAGVGSNLEIIDSEGTLRESQTLYLSALYEFMIAKIELQKSRGTLRP